MNYVSILISVFILDSFLHTLQSTRLNYLVGATYKAVSRYLAQALKYFIGRCCEKICKAGGFFQRESLSWFSKVPFVCSADLDLADSWKLLTRRNHNQ